MHSRVSALTQFPTSEVFSCGCNARREDLTRNKLRAQPYGNAAVVGVLLCETVAQFS